VKLKAGKIILAVILAVGFIFQPFVQVDAATALIPRMAIDNPKVNSTVSSSVSIDGWALNSSGIKSVSILLDGKLKGQATIGLSRPDVNAVFPGYSGGSKSGYSYSLNLSGVSAGYHTIQVQAVGVNGIRSIQSLAIKVVAKASLPLRMAVDNPSPYSLVRGSISVNGWALNPSGIKSVNVLVDGVLKGQAGLGYSRPDVNAVFPGYPAGDKSGYGYILDTSSLSAGLHTIQVQAIGNNGTKSVQNIPVKVEAKPVLPIRMAVDNPSASSLVRGNVSVNGWALNPSGIKSVNILVDGVLRGQAGIGYERVDVNSVFPGYPGGDRSGYGYIVDTSTLSAGVHTIQVQAIGNNGTKSVQSLPINVDRQRAIMSVDTLTNNAIIKNNMGINGWAINPSGMKSVTILLDGQVLGEAVLGHARPDVDKVFPGYPGGENSGFGYLLDIKTISPGPHTIKVQAVGNDGTKIEQNFTITVQKLSPRLYVESPAPNSVMKNDIYVSGWALNASGIKAINVLVDGKLHGQADKGFDRPDVNSVFPGYEEGSKSGFLYSLGFDSITMGDHQVTVQVIGFDNTKSEQSFKINRGNAFVTYKNYDITLNEFIEKEMTKTQAMHVRNELGVYEWRYAQKQNGLEGYYIYVEKVDEFGNIAIDQYGNVLTEAKWIYSPEQYQAIRQELINKINPDNLVSDNTQVYQFVKLSYASVTSAEAINAIFNSGGVLAGKGQIFIDAAKMYNVNPIYLAAHAILETGNGTSQLSTGMVVNGVKVYNLFGIGAIDSSPDASGSVTAFNNGWDSVDKAIYGGAKWIAGGYIGAGQDTLYTMRWYPLNIHHQYATDIKWATKQTAVIKNYFDMFKDAKLIFEIPVFKK
jgi:beta-N-acetylglucosaminidase